MKKRLDDNILTIQMNNETFEFLYNNNIKTLGDLLKNYMLITKAIKEFDTDNMHLKVISNNLIKINETFEKIGIKYDDELSQQDLFERNMEREEIENNQKEIRKKYNLSDLLNKKIEEIIFSESIIYNLKSYGINTLKQLLCNSSLDLLKGCFAEQNVRHYVVQIENALSKYGLFLGMIDTKTNKIEDEKDFAESPEKTSLNSEVLISVPIEEKQSEILIANNENVLQPNPADMTIKNLNEVINKIKKSNEQKKAELEKKQNKINEIIELKNQLNQLKEESIKLDEELNELLSKENSFKVK